MNAKISIIIPFYNRNSQLMSTIKSVKQQTFQEWECILVDDGSDAIELYPLESFVLNESRFIILKRGDDKAKGANACRNIGIENAKGMYIALLDSDDVWLEDYLEKQFKFAESVINFSGSYSKCLIKNGVREWMSETRDLNADESFFDFLLAKNTMAQTSSIFLKSEKAKFIQFDETLLRHQDWDFFIRFGEEYGWFCNFTTYVIINWKLGQTRTIHFPSCIKVYQKFKNRIINQENCNVYLFSMYEKAVQYSAVIQVRNFYSAELKRNNFKPRNIREHFLLKFPETYTLFRKTAIYFRK